MIIAGLFWKKDNMAKVLRKKIIRLDIHSSFVTKASFGTLHLKNVKFFSGSLLSPFLGVRRKKNFHDFFFSSDKIPYNLIDFFCTWWCVVWTYFDELICIWSLFWSNNNVSTRWRVNHQDPNGQLQHWMALTTFYFWNRYFSNSFSLIRPIIYYGINVHK